MISLRLHSKLLGIGICFASASVIISSCCKPTVVYETYYKNNTEQLIELRFYRNNASTISVIQKLSTTAINSPFDPGDSIAVFRDNVLNEVHYPQDYVSPVTSSKIIRYSAPGSLYNKNNYASEKQELNCGGSINKSTYVFNN